MKLQTKGYYTPRILFLPLNNVLITVYAYSFGILKTIIVLESLCQILVQFTLF